MVFRFIKMSILLILFLSLISVFISPSGNTMNLAYIELRINSMFHIRNTNKSPFDFGGDSTLSLIDKVENFEMTKKIRESFE